MMTKRLMFCALMTACLMGLILVGGCKDKKKKKKATTKNRPDYNQKWNDVKSLGSMGKFEIKQGREAVGKAGSPEEEEAGYMQIIEGMKHIDEAGEKAEKLFEIMDRFYPSIDYSGYESEISEWIQDRQHAKKTLPLKYADKLD